MTHMASPFPGMDPYLEGELWPDLHHMLAAVVRELIAPQLPPSYIAKIEAYNILDTEPGQDLSIMCTDVEVIQKGAPIVSEPEVAYGKETTALTPPTVKIPAMPFVEVRIPVVAIRDKKKNRLITAIESMSPVNKRNPGLGPYRNKRQKLHTNGVHLLEVDLIRRGARPFEHPLLPKSHYTVLLLRGESSETEAWTFSVRDQLPVVPVPLQVPDPDIKLDSGRVFSLAYSRSHYGAEIDYGTEPPPPLFTQTDRDWMNGLVKNLVPA